MKIQLKTKYFCLKIYNFREINDFVFIARQNMLKNKFLKIKMYLTKQKLIKSYFQN